MTEKASRIQRKVAEVLRSCRAAADPTAEAPDLELLWKKVIERGAKA